LNHKYVAAYIAKIYASTYGEEHILEGKRKLGRFLLLNPSPMNPGEIKTRDFTLRENVRLITIQSIQERFY